MERSGGYGQGTSGRQSLDVNRDGSNQSRPEGSRQNSYSQNYNLNTSGTGIGSVGMYRSPSQTQTASSPSHYVAHRTSSASQNHSRNHSTSLSLHGSQSQSQSQSQSYIPGTEGSGRSPSTSFGSAYAAARYEEAAIQRSELEAVRRENESLRQRVRELERLVSAAGTAGGVSIAQTNGSRGGGGGGGGSEQAIVGT